MIKKTTYINIETFHILFISNNWIRSIWFHIYGKNFYSFNKIPKILKNKYLNYCKFFNMNDAFIKTNKKTLFETLTN